MCPVSSWPERGHPSWCQAARHDVIQFGVCSPCYFLANMPIHANKFGLWGPRLVKPWWWFSIFSWRDLVLYFIYIYIWYITPKDQTISRCSLKVSSDIMGTTMWPDTFWVRSWGLSGISLDTIVLWECDQPSIALCSRHNGFMLEDDKPTHHCVVLSQPAAPRCTSCGASAPFSKRWHESCISSIGSEAIKGNGCGGRVIALRFRIWNSQNTIT